MTSGGVQRDTSPCEEGEVGPGEARLHEGLGAVTTVASKTVWTKDTSYHAYTAPNVRVLTTTATSSSQAKKQKKKKKPVVFFSHCHIWFRDMLSLALFKQGPEWEEVHPYLFLPLLGGNKANLSCRGLLFSPSGRLLTCGEAPHAKFHCASLCCVLFDCVIVVWTWGLIERW